MGRHLPGLETAPPFNSPLVIVRGRSNGATTKYCLTLDKILLATREDRAV